MMLTPHLFSLGLSAPQAPVFLSTRSAVASNPFVFEPVAPPLPTPQSPDFIKMLQFLVMMMFISPPATDSSKTEVKAESPSTETKLTHDDLVNYFLAGSRGGTTGTVEVIEDRYARPDSRFAGAGPNEFDAVVAEAYAGQFKAYALGLDVVFNPGDDVDQLARNLTQALNAPMNSEAELFAKVAAVYRGDLPGEAHTYNNRALKDLLIKWGRSDLANRPNVGVTDVESIGGIVQALAEEPQATLRQQWLQEIFDFRGNTLQSPSGGVPYLEAYQRAISIVQNGELDRLLDNYRAGIRTGDRLQGTQPGTIRPIPQ